MRSLRRWAWLIDASRWRDTAAQQAAAALGRPVSLQGALELSLGRTLQLRLGELRILNPPGFSGPQFLEIGELRVRFDLFDVLRGRWRLRSVEASDVQLWLERAADGRDNWTTPPRDPGAPPAPVDVDQVKLQRLGLHYHDSRTAARHSVALESVSGSAVRNQPLQLAVRGQLEPGWAYLLELEGGPLQQLQDAAEPWPLEIELRSRGARLHADGALDTRQRAARMRVEAHADDPAAIARLAGAQVPALGRAMLHGTLSLAADAVSVTELHGWLGESEFSGQLALALDGARPRLSGALSAATLDLRPFLAASAEAPGEPRAGGAPASPQSPLRDLAALDVELDLQVERALGLPLELRDASIALRADAQGLRAPLSLTLARVPFTGRLDLDTAAPVPSFALQLNANDAVLGELARELGYASGIDGTLGRLALRIDGRGPTLATLAGDLELSLAVAAARLRFGNDPTGRPIAIALDTLDLSLGRGEPLRGMARGTLRGEPARLSFRGGTLRAMLRERALPLELELALAQARLRLQSVLPWDDAHGEAVLRFDFQARRAGDLARWIGVAPQASLPVALRGQLRRVDAAWMLEPTTLELGRSRLTVAARRSLAEGRPIVWASVRSPLIDVQELSTLRAGSGGANGSRRDATVFGDAVDVADVNVDVELQRLLLGRAELEDIAFVARTRDARLMPAALTGKLAGAPFHADVALDLHGELPTASLDLSTGSIDLGALLRRLGLAQDIEGRAQALHLKLQGRGSSPGELLAHSAIDVRLSGGHVTVRGAGQRPLADIRLDQASIGAPPGEPVHLRLDGTLDQVPVRLDLSTGTLADFARDATLLPFALTARAAGARLALDGEVHLPLGSGGKLTLEMSGERLDSLSPLARVELPAWGPWSFRGPLRMTPNGYELQGLEVAVGRSRLDGSGSLDLSGPRPNLQLQVAAPSIRIDDFPWPQPQAEPPAEGAGLRGSASRMAVRTDKLLSAAFLRRFDATVDVKAKEVLSGSDRLADGALHFQLKEGRLRLDPAVVNLPGGSLRLSMAYDLKESEVDVAVAAQVERFDYGVIARRLRRADDLRGLFSLNLEMAGTAPSLDTIMRNASGRIDFAVWPTELRSGIFNLWTANLVLTVLPLIDPGSKSQVNCIIGRFDLKDGDLSDDKILIDTSTVRIRGVGHANLATEELAFVFRPQAKGYGLFRLQTPLRAGGTLTDQRFYFTQADVAESVLRLIASPVLLPIEWLTRGPLPRDGADVCTDSLRALAP